MVDLISLGVFIDVMFLGVAFEIHIYQKILGLWEQTQQYLY